MTPKDQNNLFAMDHGGEGDELFGDILPAGYVPLGKELSNLIGDINELERWATAEAEKPPLTPFNARENYPRAYKLLEKLHPGKFWKLDYQEITYSRFIKGRPDPNSIKVVAKDMLGFADVGGLIRPHGRMVCANITTIGQIAPHLRKYTDPQNTHAQAKIPVETHLREYLACGGLFYIFGYHQPKGKGTAWVAEVVVVTPQLLDEYVARKRGPRTAPAKPRATRYTPRGVKK